MSLFNNPSPESLKGVQNGPEAPRELAQQRQAEISALLGLLGQAMQAIGPVIQEASWNSYSVAAEQAPVVKHEPTPALSESTKLSEKADVTDIAAYQQNIARQRITEAINNAANNPLITGSLNEREQYDQEAA